MKRRGSDDPTARSTAMTDMGLAPSVTVPQPASPPHAVAERRQLTVLFCDLADSTALSARLDPEDMREVIGAYQTACADVIVRHDGFVAKFMGDGLLAYFSYPRAHEDEAERAVRAGLEIVASVGGLQTPAREALWPLPTNTASTMTDGATDSMPPPM